MKDKDIKNINKKNLICKTLKKPEKLCLCHATKAEKIEYPKMS